MQLPTYHGDPGLVGGALCLDFANAIGPRLATGQQRQYISSYADLVGWGLHARVLREGDAAGLMVRASEMPDAAEWALGRALALREASYTLFRALSEGVSPAQGDLEVINGALAEAMAEARLSIAGAGFVWGWPDMASSLDSVWWPVARSAAELLTDERLARVRACANDTCGWLFLDTSKNRSRRWCSMDDCGNRAKARRHYGKVRSEARG